MLEAEGPLLNIDDVPDKAGDIFKGCEIKAPLFSRVPVYYEFSEDPKDYLGEAIVCREGNKLFCKIKLAEGSLINDLARHEGIKLTPCVGGQVLKRSETDSNVIEKVVLTNIGLTLKGNQDPRIPPLKFIDSRFLARNWDKKSNEEATDGATGGAT